MKPKILILTPVYKDWNNLKRLLKKIDKIFLKQIKNKFNLIIVDDASGEKISLKKSNYRSIKKLSLLSLSKNVGSQRAIALGLRFIGFEYKKKFGVVIMDSDGQDNPKGIVKFFEKSRLYPNQSIVANRGQRKEPFWFRLCYETYRNLIKVFTLKNIKFGNFSYIVDQDIKKIFKKSDLWSAYPPTVINNLKIKTITIDRDKRFTGDSKMNFVKLIIHAARVFSVLKIRILLSSSIFSLIGYFTFFEKNLIVFYLLITSLILFNFLNFLLPICNSKEFSKNFKKLKIKNF